MNEIDKEKAAREAVMAAARAYAAAEGRAAKTAAGTVLTLAVMEHNAACAELVSATGAQ